jgi:hypothetical protein
MGVWRRGVYRQMVEYRDRKRSVSFEDIWRISFVEASIMGVCMEIYRSTYSALVLLNSSFSLNSGTWIPKT